MKKRNGSEGLALGLLTPAFPRKWLISLSFSVDFDLEKSYVWCMPFVLDQRGKAGQRRQNVEALGRGRKGGLRGLGARDGAAALSPGKLTVKEGHGIGNAAKRLRPDPKKPETCKLPVRITGHEQYKALGAQYEQLMTLVFIRTMDLFRAFGIDFQLILGGSGKDGDVIIDASLMGGVMPSLQLGRGNQPSRGPGGPGLMPPGWNPFQGLAALVDGQMPPTENVPPGDRGPTREPPGGPVREPPTGSPHEPPVRNPGGPTRPPGGGPIRNPPDPDDPTRVPPGTRPPTEDNPTREPPDFERPGDIGDDVDRNWPTVAENETARVWGDPHFVGADGGKFDVQGEAGKTYNLLNDTGLQFFGTFDGWGNGITVVGSTGLTVTGRGGTSQVHHDPKKDSVKVDGQELAQGKSVVMADGGTTTRQGKDVVTTTAEGYRIVQHDQGKHIDAEVTSGDRGVHNGQMPTGLMGCTFDADKKKRDGKKGSGAQGEGAIDGVVGDYEVTGGVFGQARGCGKPGDMDGDGKVSLQDAHMVLNHVMGRQSLTPAQAMQADVDKDGYVTMADALFILRYAQANGGMGARVADGNGRPITLPKNGTLSVSVLSYGAEFASRAEAESPIFKRLFHGGNLKSQVGAQDQIAPVRAGDVLNLGVRADALGSASFHDLQYNGETFMVQEQGEGRWLIGWAGPNGLGKADFSSAVFEVALIPDEQKA